MVLKDTYSNSLFGLANPVVVCSSHTNLSQISYSSIGRARIKKCLVFAFLIQTALNSDLKSGGTVKRMAGSTSGRRFNLTIRRQSKNLDKRRSIRF